MKRIDVHYQDTRYSIGGRELADVQAEIVSYASTGGWLLVNDGEGERRDALLWITSATPIALVPIPDVPAA